MARARKSNIDTSAPATPTSEIQEAKNGFCQWTILGDNAFAPGHDTVHQLTAGFYEMKWQSSIGQYILELKSVQTDELYELPSPAIKDIIEDIQKFWDNEQRYKAYNFVHKRGILLYGDPGCGKSGIIQLCTKHLIENLNGIVLNITDTDSLIAYNDLIPKLRKIEPNRPIITIMEDIDAICGDNREYTSMILNILDGAKQIDNVVYIATTNYPEKLAERITNRPSRFDRRYEIEMPGPEVREAYIKNKLTASDLRSIDIKEWIKATDNFSLAHMRELIISTMTMGNSFEETINRLNGLQVKPKIKRKNQPISLDIPGGYTGRSRGAYRTGGSAGFDTSEKERVEYDQL
jgi:predicted AAA+ superfamily ATPase